MIARILCRLGLHQEGKLIFRFRAGVPRERWAYLPPWFNAYVLHDRWDVVAAKCRHCGKRFSL